MITVVVKGGVWYKFLVVYSSSIANKIVDFLLKNWKVIVAVSAVTLLAATLKCLYLERGNFPINDGGMFASMIDDLLKSNFRLPKFTSYNNLDIPFSYPPLAFYIGAALIRLLPGLTTLQLLTFLPMVVSVLSVPLVYLLFRLFGFDRKVSVVALIVFVLHPRSSEWFIMGGGLTRSVGLFMALSTLAIMLQMAKRQSLRLCMLGGLFMALTILSHPEISVFLLITLGLYFVFEVKNRGILMWFLGSFVVAALLITPWFWGVYSQHGIMPFLAAINSGNASYWGSGPAIALLTFDFIGYNGLYLFGGIGLLGLLIIILKKRYFFFVWPLVIAVINYRSFGHFVPIFFGLYVGVGLIDVVVVGLTDWIHKQGKSWSTETIMKATVFAVYLGAIYYVSASFMGIIPRMSTYHTLDANNREAMYWVTLNTPVQSRFLVLDVWAFRNWPIDMVSEWFPYVADRSSIMTIQGREWLPDFGFSKTYTDAIQLAKCSDDIKCFLDKLDEANLGPVDYIYIDHHALAASENVKTVVQSINEKLYQDWGYEIVYDDGTVTIWRLVAD